MAMTIQRLLHKSLSIHEVLKAKESLVKCPAAADCRLVAFLSINDLSIYVPLSAHRFMT